jgi:PAS domain S-box-containing protein
LAQRKRIEQDLRDNEEKYRTLVDTSADAILLQTPTGKIVDCNSAACRLFGYSKDEFALLEMGDLVPENVARLLPKEITKNLTTGGAFVETVYKRRNNRTFSAEVSSQMINVGGDAFVIAFIRDITQRKQAEEAIRDSEERYRSLFETSPDAIALTDLRGVIRLCNQKAAQIFDYDSPDEMVGVNVFDLIASEDRQNAIDSTREVYKGATRRDLDYIAVSRKGRRFPCELSASTIYDKAGKPKGFTGILRDISDRKQKARENIAVVVIASALRMAVTLDEISQSILNQLLGVLNAEGAAIFMGIPATGEALCVRGVGRWQQWTGLRLDAGEGLTSRVIRYGQAFVNNDILHNKQTARLELTGGLNAVAGAPLISKERTIGALWVGRNQAFREGEQQILMVIADMVANAVQRAALYEDLYKSNRELEESYDRTLEGWSRAMDMRDKETEDHNQRVAEMTVQLARLMGIPELELVHIRRGAMLHDIGKISIRDAVLLKTGKLTDSDWLAMREHPRYARDFIEPIPYLRPAIDIPYCHHEHWDGSGYPNHLKGEDIPLSARIFSVIDVWDALTHDRVYRPRWPEDRARQYILENAGVLFDPKVVEVFLQMIG